MGALWQDIRYSLRVLRKSPGFTAVAVLTLALGLGANTSVFSVINTVLLHPLPLQEPNRLARLLAARDRATFLSPEIVSYPDFSDWREQSRSFAELAAYTTKTKDIITAGFPENLSGLAVSQGFFEVLGAKPARGRTFLEGEDQPGAAGVIVLSHKTWQQHFAGGRDILGQTVQLDEAAFTVVGVLPADFPAHLVDDPEFVIPLTERRKRNWAGYKVIGRIRPGVTLLRAQERLSAVLARLQEERGGAIADAHMTPFSQYVAGNARLYLLALLGATGFVLLIACVNLANLVLARMATRQKEIAVRRALGAGLFRVARQMLAESLLLTLVGGAGGVLLALWTSDLLRLHLVGFVPRAQEIRVDTRVLGFALLVAGVSGFLVAIVPVLRLRRCAPGSLLGERFKSTRAGNRFSDALVAFEIGAALILLTGAGLMIRTFRNLTTADPGFNADRLLSFRVRLPEARYGEVTQRQTFCQQALDHLSALPGVGYAAMSNMIPYGRTGMYTEITLPERSAAEGGKLTDIGCHVITSDYLAALDTPLLSGRSFSRSDFSGQAQTALINRELAQKCWPDEDPVGRMIKVGWPAEPYEVVGVVANTFQEEPTKDMEMKVYLPYGSATTDRYCGLYCFVVRTHGDPAAMIAAVRRAMLEVDPALPVQRLAPMPVHMAGSIRQERFTLISLGLFAALAMVLVAIGIYGVVSYVVSRRTHAVGVCIALGAQYSQIMGMILRRGLILATIGSAIGIAGALGLTRFLSSYLYGVTPTDPTTFVLVPIVLVAVALLACYIPARRAAKIDPMEALRYE